MSSLLALGTSRGLENMSSPEKPKRDTKALNATPKYGLEHPLVVKVRIASYKCSETGLNYHITHNKYVRLLLYIRFAYSLISILKVKHFIQMKENHAHLNIDTSLNFWWNC